ncbi:MAG: type II toxin-antitoxin system VapC family toxin [Planctomycetes bacterium]|nr:type II toxin-antitoxin system VapC family toxin [Planctomycetota bacterium]
MRLLLDTHTFIWWDSEPGRLSPSALAACCAPVHALVLSVVSVWEMQIKLQLGKLQLQRPLVELIADQQRRNRIEIPPVSLAHALKVGELPSHHRDPFDRMLIAQACVDGLTVVTADAAFTSYPAPILW